MDAIQTASTCNVSPVAVEQIKMWPEICEREHQECKEQGAKRNSEIGPPFCLIDVGTSTDPSAHLIHSSDIIRDFKYITLSHHWTGDTERTKLTRSNRDTSFRCMPLKD